MSNERGTDDGFSIGLGAAFGRNQKGLRRIAGAKQKEHNGRLGETPLRLG